MERQLAASNERIATLKAALVIAGQDSASWQANAIEWERKAMACKAELGKWKESSPTETPLGMLAVVELLQEDRDNFSAIVAKLIQLHPDWKTEIESMAKSKGYNS